MSAKKSILIGFVFALIILTPLFAVFHSKFPNKPIEVKPGEIISGKIDLNGYVPDKSYIEIGERERGTDKFTIVAQNLPAQDGAMWYWAQSQKNKNYELKAYLKQNDKTISESGVLTITAPATEEVLSINSKAEPPKPPETTPVNSPEASPSSQTTTSPRRAMIAGVVDLNGNIPANSIIQIVQRTSGDPTFQIAENNIQAVDGANWVWKGAQVGSEYEIQAYILSQGQTIGQSQILTIAAPALNEVLVINSIAQPAAPTTGVVTGQINLNGQIPQGNISIVVYERVQGTNNFNVAQDSISPSNGAIWTWGNASSGTTYEIIAVLKQQNAPDVATSPILVVTAPADEEVLTLNTNVSLPPPTGNPAISCVNQTSIGQWNIMMSVSPYNNAGDYLLQIGSQSGGTDILNSQVNLSGSINAGAVINNNTTYYARYAYGFCINCPFTSFSAFSNTLSFTCPPQAPSPAPYTGYVCQTNICQLTAQPNPPYPYNIQGLVQCQLNCMRTPAPVTPSPVPTIAPTPVPTSQPTPPPTPKPTDPPIPSNKPEIMKVP